MYVIIVSLIQFNMAHCDRNKTSWKSSDLCASVGYYKWHTVDWRTLILMYTIVTRPCSILVLGFSTSSVKVYSLHPGLKWKICRELASYLIKYFLKPMVTWFEICFSRKLVLFEKRYLSLSFTNRLLKKLLIDLLSQQSMNRTRRRVELAFVQIEQNACWWRFRADLSIQRWYGDENEMKPISQAPLEISLRHLKELCFLLFSRKELYRQQI